MKIVSGRDKHFQYPAPATLQIALYGPEPISEARVVATVRSPYGETQEFALTEHLLPAATLPESGSYAAVLATLSEDGRYHVVITASDNDGRARFATPFGEDLPSQPKGREDTGGTRHLGPFRVESQFDFRISGYSGAPPLPPLRVTTLYASVRSDRCVHLSWQVPPNIERGAAYEIRYSSVPITSEAAWRTATPADRAAYAQEGLSSQEHTMCDLPRGMYYIALRSMTAEGVESELSNDYAVRIE